MNDFFKALLADLRDRRILPLVALLGVALLGAVAYAALGGGSGGGAPATSAAVVPPAGRGLAVTQTTPETAAAETTSGAAEQRTGHSRDPFKLLPGAGKQEGSASTQGTGTSAAASAGSSAGSGSSESGAGGSGSGSGGSGKGKGEEEAKPTKPKKPSRPRSLYHVAVLFGAIPAGTPPLVAELPPLENIKLLTPLPSTGQPLIVFRGVTAGGRSATFSLVGEAILHGQAVCLPNATQCQAIDLAKERYEQFETLAPSGEVVTYELRVVSIASRRASTASVHRLLSEQSKAGRALLRAAGMLAIPLLRVSTQPGVLVFAPAPRAARAHAARREHRR